MPAHPPLYRRALELQVQPARRTLTGAPYSPAHVAARRLADLSDMRMEERSQPVDPGHSTLVVVTWQPPWQHAHTTSFHGHSSDHQDHAGSSDEAERRIRIITTSFGQLLSQKKEICITAAMTMNNGCRSMKPIIKAMTARRWIILKIRHGVEL